MHLHLSQDDFVKSTRTVTSTRTCPWPHHDIHVRVLTLKEPPEGTSGVCVTVS